MRAWIDFQFEIYEMHPETDGKAPGKIRLKSQKF